MTTIAVLGSGGTISAVADARRRNGDGLGAEAIARNAGALPGVDIRTVDVRRIPGRAMTPSDMVSIARAVGEQLDAGADGVVVTHGTDTVEETAYALALMVTPVAPIVLTAAMRLPEDAGHDGGANFRAAVAAASDPRVGDLGPVVAIQDELHLARWVTKAHTSRVAAFASPETGPAGTVAEGRVVLTGLRALDDHMGLPAPQALSDTRVELISVAAGMDGLLVDAAARRAAGIVVAGSGGGHVPPPVADALARAIARGVHVVIASRCAAGPTLNETYGGPGGELHLREIGATAAGTIPALKARLRLQVALALGLSPGEVFPA